MMKKLLRTAVMIGDVSVGVRHEDDGDDDSREMMTKKKRQ